MGSLTHIPVASCPRRHQPPFQLFLPFSPLSLSLSRLLSPARTVLHRFSSRNQRTHAALVSTLLSFSRTGPQADQLITALFCSPVFSHWRDVEAFLHQREQPRASSCIVPKWIFHRSQKASSCHTVCFFGPSFFPWWFFSLSSFWDNFAVF